MKILIFGAGDRGKALLSHLRKDDVVAFIDNDKSKVGLRYEGKPVISIEEYKKKYSNYFIQIGVHNSKEIKEQFYRENIKKYFDSLECPTEWQIHGNIEKFKEFLLSHIVNLEGTIGIYGSSLYCIYLYEILEETGYKEIYLIPECGAEKDRIKFLKEENKFLQIYDKSIELDKIISGVNRIYIEKEIKEKIGNKKIKIIDLFNNVGKINIYNNTNIKKFKNIHRNERCFIIGTGSSLKMKDLDKLNMNKENSISMNRIYLSFSDTNWRPDYYVCMDRFLIEEWERDIKKIPVKNKFIGDRFPDFWKGKIDDGIYKLHSYNSQVINGKARFSREISEGVYLAGSTTYVCIQIAVYLGFKKIYLLGLDHNLTYNIKEESNHFTPNYFSNKSKVNGTWNFLEIATKEYLAAKEYADSHGIKIYNATRGGKLEVFERVCFDDLFDKEG